MRVQEMFYLVNHALDEWVNPQFSEMSKNVFSCLNEQQIVNILEPLRPFPEINKQIEIIYSTDDTFGDDSVFIPSEKEKIDRAMGAIKANLLAMRSMCEALGVESNSVGFDVKLPPNITLPELSDFAKDLNSIFTQCPILRQAGEEIKLHGVDVGSIWMTFTIIGAGAAIGTYILKNIAAMVDHVVTIREHMAVCKQQEELARSAGLKNESLDTIVNANKQIMKSLINKATDELSKENQVTNSEDKERIRLSLGLLKEWIDKGMEIYSAIDAPQDVKAAFPPLEAQALPDFSLKKLIGREESE